MKEILDEDPRILHETPYRRVLNVLSEAIQQEVYMPGDRLPSMKDLAKQLGVHYLTVRKAIVELSRRNLLESRVGLGTFVRHAPEAGGRADKKVLRLAAVHSDRILRHHDGGHPALALWIDGLNRREALRDTTVQVHCYREGRFVEDVGRILLDSQVDGVIHLGASDYEHFYLFCRDHSLPLIEVSAYRDSHDWATVVRLDVASMMRRALDYLWSLGHEQVAYIGYRNIPSFEYSKEMFVRLAKKHQPDSDASIVVVANEPDAISWSDVNGFFSLEPRPTAVIVQDEFIAGHLIQGCAQRGVAVPGQLSIVAIQDLWRLHWGATLTTLFPYRAYRETISMAANLLVRKIKGESLDSLYLIGAQLCVGNSTAPPPGDPDHAIHSE